QMEQLQKIAESNPTIMKIVYFLLCVLIVYLVRRTILNRLYPRLKEHQSWYGIRKTAVWTGNILLALVFIYIFGRGLQGVPAALGLAGAGVTYALKEVIVSFAGWFAIMFGDFFKLGDRILLGGIKGDVVDIGFLRTTLMEIGEWVEGDQYTGRFVRVANSYIFNSPVYNYTADFDYLWDEIHIPIRFSSDIEEARNILLDLADHQIGNYNAPST